MALPAHPDASDAWRLLRAELRRRLGQATYEVWLAGLEVVEWDGRTLVLRGRPETELWVSHRYGRLLAESAERTLGPGARVRLTRDGSGAEPARGPFGADAGPSDPILPELELNPRYRFEQFIIGETNRLAHAAALAVAENPGQAYNPLFLSAPPGLGKTHLLHAIGNYVHQFGGGAQVRYTTAESFTNHFLTALSSRSLEPFKRAYRGVDVLLVDDVQFLADKARTEEEFFHTFNALYENGRQLVLSCDRLPRALTAIEQRLRERFEAGLVADIAPPDRAVGVAILRKRAALDGIQVADPAVLELIAARAGENIRVLEGALIRVVAFASLTGRDLDLALAREVLDIVHPAPHRAGTGGAPSVQDVQAAVAGRFGVSVEQMRSPSRAAAVNWARQVAITLARDLTGMTLPQIGAEFGGRNHATVIHACKRVSERLKTDAEAVDALAQLRRELGPGE